MNFYEDILNNDSSNNNNNSIEKSPIFPNYYSGQNEFYDNFSNFQENNMEFENNPLIEDNAMLEKETYYRTNFKQKENKEKQEEKDEIKKNEKNDGYSNEKKLNNNKSFHPQEPEEKKDEEKKEISHPESKIYNKKNKLEDKTPEQYKYKKIKYEIFPKLTLNQKTNDSYIKDEFIKKLDKDLSDDTYEVRKTRERGKPKPPEEEPKKQGRKKLEDHSDRKHNKKAADNISKKIKTFLLKYLLKFINSFLKSSFNEEQIKSYIKLTKKSENIRDKDLDEIIKKINYNSIVNKTKKEDNLMLFKLTLKEFLSNNITSKYISFKENSNKIITEKTLNETDNKIIKYVFDLKFQEWFDIFTHKKELDDFKLEQVEIDEIMKNFIRIEMPLEEFYENNNENKNKKNNKNNNINNNNNDINKSNNSNDNKEKNEYFSDFVSMIYNYERYFFFMQSRKRNVKNNNEEDEK